MQSGGLRTKGIAKKSQENMPLITVVTVVRNGEKTLEQTILSVINQTYKNVEYIIVDGASIDGTLEIIRKYEDRIDYWISEPDGGIYYAMNKGIDAATGEWINFMNTGDSFYLETVLTEFCSYINSGIDIFYGSAYFSEKGINAHNKTINDLYFLMGYMVCHQAIFARKKLFFIRKFDTSLVISADKDWLIYLYKYGIKLKLIPIIVCNYDTTGISSNISKTRKDFFVIIKRYYGYSGFFFVYLKYLCGRVVRTGYRKLLAGRKKSPHYQ
jgi:glycosyltransferase involved in cell wall biosynthesis